MKVGAQVVEVEVVEDLELVPPGNDVPAKLLPLDRKQ